MTDGPHRFSRRTSWDLQPSPLSAAIAEARSAGRELIDLTVSNPTICGFDYDSASIFDSVGIERNDQAALTYDPDPRGMRSAREGVVRYYEQHGAPVNPDSIILTTSTSEAYSYLFRLLCDAGDEVLVAQPSYPLFDFLATLDDVSLKPYPLFYDYGWWIDFAELERRIGPRTRAMLVVHPNNPTGHWTHLAEREKLEELCERRGLALIVDEVFLDYAVAAPGNETPAKSFASGPHPVLTFVLSGISKIAALPQMKVAWLAALGPAKAVADALARLEVIADTFLSMNALTQLALPTWLEHSPRIQSQIRSRTESNLQTIQASGLDVLKVEAGWSAVLRLREFPWSNSRSAAVALLERTGVIVHPGDFYGLADQRTVVVSLITPIAAFQSGIRKMSDLADRVNLEGYPQR